MAGLDARRCTSFTRSQRSHGWDDAPGLVPLEPRLLLSYDLGIYFPMDNGLSWSFQGTFGSAAGTTVPTQSPATASIITQRPLSVLGQVTTDFDMALSVQGSGTVDHLHRYYSLDADGLKLHRSSEVGATYAYTTTYNTPMLILPRSMSDATVFAYNGSYAGVDNQSITWNGIVSGSMTIFSTETLTAGGRSIEALKIQHEETFLESSPDVNGSGTITETLWLAAGLGMVKNTRLLVENYGAGNNATQYTMTMTGSSLLNTVTITAPDAAAAEAGSNPGQFLLSRTGSTALPLEVHLGMAGTASTVAGVDYALSSTMFTIPAGQSQLAINLTPVDDLTIEGTETVIASILPDSEYAIGTANQATVSIADNDLVYPANPFVRDMYLNVLYRGADEPGVAYWSGRLDQGSLTRTGLMTSLITSTEFSQQVSPVIELYLGFLGPNGTFAPSAYQPLADAITAARMQGKTLAQLADGLRQSTAFSQVHGSDLSSLTPAQFVAWVYQTALNRSPGGGDPDYAAQLTASTLTRGQVMSAVAATSEFRTLAGLQYRAQVSAIYMALLARGPDPSGLDFWANRLRDGQPMINIVQGFTRSVEFGKAGFVRNTYWSVLGRGPDAPGLRNWIDALTAGTVKAPQLIQGFVQSTEFDNTIAPLVRMHLAYSATSGSLGTTDYASLVNGIARLRAGTRTLGQLADELRDTALFTGVHGSNLASLDATQFVAWAYQTALGRQPNAGAAAFVTALDQGTTTRGQVMLSLTNGFEFRNLPLVTERVRVAMVYVTLMGRSGDLTGLTGWSQAVKAGGSITAVAGSFLASSEYGNKAQAQWG